MNRSTLYPIHRKPARRVHQVRDVVLDGAEFDAVNRRVFLAGQPPIVSERQRSGFAFHQRGRKAHLDIHVLPRPRGGNLVAAVIHHARDIECVVQFEGR